MWSAPSLPLLPGPLGLGIVVLVRFSTMCQIEQSNRKNECKQMFKVKLNSNT